MPAFIAEQECRLPVDRSIRPIILCNHLFNPHTLISTAHVRVFLLGKQKIVVKYWNIVRNRPPAMKKSSDLQQFFLLFRRCFQFLFHIEHEPILFVIKIA